MMMALGPVQALAREGTSHCAQWCRVNVERAQESLAHSRKQEHILALPQHIPLQQFVSESNRKHAGQVVVTGSSKAQFGDGDGAGGLRQGGQGFNGRRNVPLFNR